MFNPTIYQFKISLDGISPKIWRRIQVPKEYNFTQLHLVIQNAMGWSNSHLYQFRMEEPDEGYLISIGDQGCDILADKSKISDYFYVSINAVAKYDYDFGDDWQHTILLEKLIPKAKDVKYPICIGGKRACPPEDCGGIYGYQDLINALKEPSSAKYNEYKELLESKFDPEHFDTKEVIFE